MITFSWSQQRTSFKFIIFLSIFISGLFLLEIIQPPPLITNSQTSLESSFLTVYNFLLILYNSLSRLFTIFFIFLIWTTNLAWDAPTFFAKLENYRNKYIVDELQKKFQPFRVPFWGLSAILQSIYPVHGRDHAWKHQFKREILDTHSGGIIAVDWLLNEEEIKHNLNPETDFPELATAASLNPDQTQKRMIAWCKKQHDCECSRFEGLNGRPVIILVPGLTNCSDTRYVRTFAEYCKENGWIPVIFIWRGLGGLPLTSPKLFEPGDTADFDIAVKHIQSRVGSAPIAAVGWSLGGNLLCKYLGERKTNVPFFAGASIGQGYSASRVFKIAPSFVLKRIGYNFQSMVEIHKSHFQNSHNLKEVLQPGLTVQEFDEKFSLKEFSQYQSTDAYYDANSCSHLLQDISIPVLLLNAKDDPVVVPEVLPYKAVEQNDNLILTTTTYGGHLGFATGLFFSDKYAFSDRLALEWFNLSLGFSKPSCLDLTKKNCLKQFSKQHKLQTKRHRSDTKNSKPEEREAADKPSSEFSLPCFVDFGL